MTQSNGKHAELLQQILGESVNSIINEDALSWWYIQCSNPDNIIKLSKLLNINKLFDRERLYTIASILIDYERFFSLVSLGVPASELIKLHYFNLILGVRYDNFYRKVEALLKGEKTLDGGLFEVDPNGGITLNKTLSKADEWHKLLDPYTVESDESIQEESEFCDNNEKNQNHSMRAMEAESEGEYSVAGTDFLSSVSEHKKSIRAVELSGTCAQSGVRSQSAGDGDVYSTLGSGVGESIFSTEGKNQSRATRSLADDYIDDIDNMRQQVDQKSVNTAHSLSQDDNNMFTTIYNMLINMFGDEGTSSNTTVADIDAFIDSQCIEPHICNKKLKLFSDIGIKITQKCQNMLVRLPQDDSRTIKGWYKMYDYRERVLHIVKEYLDPDSPYNQNQKFLLGQLNMAEDAFCYFDSPPRREDGEYIKSLGQDRTLLRKICRVIKSVVLNVLSHASIVGMAFNAANKFQTGRWTLFSTTATQRRTERMTKQLLRDLAGTSVKHNKYASAG